MATLTTLSRWIDRLEARERAATRPRDLHASITARMESPERTAELIAVVLDMLPTCTRGPAKEVLAEIAATHHMPHWFLGASTRAARHPQEGVPGDDAAQDAASARALMVRDDTTDDNAISDAATTSPRAAARTPHVPAHRIIVPSARSGWY